MQGGTHIGGILTRNRVDLGVIPINQTKMHECNRSLIGLSMPEAQTCVSNCNDLHVSGKFKKQLHSL